MRKLPPRKGTTELPQQATMTFILNRLLSSSDDSDNNFSKTPSINHRAGLMCLLCPSNEPPLFAIHHYSSLHLVYRGDWPDLTCGTPGLSLVSKMLVKALVCHA
jgi:hypothetical protein